MTRALMSPVSSAGPHASASAPAARLRAVKGLSGILRGHRRQRNSESASKFKTDTDQCLNQLCDGIQLQISCRRWSVRQKLNTQRMKEIAQALIPTKIPQQKNCKPKVVRVGPSTSGHAKAERPLSVAELRMQLRSAPRK